MQVLYNTVVLWLLQVGVAVMVHGEGTLQLLYHLVAPVGVAPAYPYNYSNLH